MCCTLSLNRGVWKAIRYYFFSSHEYNESPHWWCKKYSHNAFVIFDTVELHFLRGICEVALKDVGKSKEHELGIMSKVDLTFVYNSVRHDILSGKITEWRIENVHPPYEIPGNTTNFENWKEIAFIGEYRHPPNVDAVKYLVKKIFTELPRKG